MVFRVKYYNQGVRQQPQESILTVFPPNSTCKLLIIPQGLYFLPSKAFNVIDDCDNHSEPSDFQQFREIMHVDAPSSIIVR